MDPNLCLKIECDLFKPDNKMCGDKNIAVEHVDKCDILDRVNTQHKSKMHESACKLVDCGFLNGIRCDQGTDLKKVDEIPLCGLFVSRAQALSIQLLTADKCTESSCSHLDGNFCKEKGKDLTIVEKCGKIKWDWKNKEKSNDEWSAEESEDVPDEDPIDYKGLSKEEVDKLEDEREERRIVSWMGKTKPVIDIEEYEKKEEVK